MLRKVGNQAYRALARVLDLAGTEHLGTLDLGVAQPVHVLDRVVEAGLVTHWQHSRVVTAGGAGIQNSLCRPWLNDSWTVILKDGEAVDPNADFVPLSDDYYCVGCAFTSDATSTLDRALFGRVSGTTALTPKALEVLWDGRDAEGIAAWDVAEVLLPTVMVPPPWVFIGDRTAGAPPWNRSAPVFDLQLTGACDYNVTIYGYSTPPGVLPLLP